MGSLLPLYTPAAAAELLAMRESWLRRRATARTVPCTFLGKHLRFSHADIVAIATAGARPVGAPSPDSGALPVGPGGRVGDDTRSARAASALGEDERPYPIRPTDHAGAGRRWMSGRDG